MEDLHLGAKIERYTVEDLLGEGGMAAVYRVRHDTLGTMHALKVLTIGGKKIRQRLVHEGRVQAMLDHPNVVAVRDVLDVNGSPGLLMDFIDGPDLDDWIRDQKPDPALALDVFRQIVGAVEAAHKAGLVHRDLKPANVLMRKRKSGGWQAKVADFGLAKALEEGKDSLSLTKSGASLGTPSYMAPEQIKDASTVDNRADVWALGAIFYELLTGEQAFEGLDIVEVFNRVSDGEYTPLQQLRPDLPLEFATTIDACLVVDRDQRLANCAAILSRLEGREGPPPAEPTWELIAPSRSPAARLAGERATPKKPERPQTPPPTAQRARATPLAWAIPIAMAAVIGGGSIAGVMGVVWIAKHYGSEVAINCSGWVRANGPVFLKEEGQVWTVPGDRDVVSALPSPDNNYKAGEPSCTLASGSRVTLIESPERLGRAGIWVRVMPDNVEPPEPNEEPTAP